MCGIAFIVSGVRFDLSSSIAIPINPSSELEQPLFSIDDLKAALQRRGPDSLGSKRILLSAIEADGVVYIVERDEETNGYLQNCDGMSQCISEDLCMIENGVDQTKTGAELCFIGATLQLRGTSPIVQPLVDAFGNILVYNGEIFGGIYVGSDRNDTEVLMESLRNCSSCSFHEDSRPCYDGKKEPRSISDVLSTIKGPWALIYWQASSKTLWFGRDGLGRRSLLVHWPSLKDSRLLLSSVAPPCSIAKASEFADECGMSEMNFWEELPCGVYNLQVSSSKLHASMYGEIKKLEWADPVLRELISWERRLIQPRPEDLNICQMKIPCRQHKLESANTDIVPNELGHIQASVRLPAEAVLHVLRQAVMRRSATNTMFKAPKVVNKQDWRAPIAVLFSGGLDSMILAALLDDCLDAKYEIDLLNVSFDGVSAPDRISARAGVEELQRISSMRRWNLVEIDAELSKLAPEMKHVMSLITPAKTFMDLNIGLALWLAAAGDGWIYEERFHANCDENGYKNNQRSKFKSDARILLVGSGADEQCAGYGRHRTKYRNASWLGLHQEMKLDMQRIWKRNLGRDDRCIADNGKEARFPFLDEDVIKTLLSFPLWEIADLNQPSGKGDKKILREVAQLLGLSKASVLPKRAIQFGSRIARESNRRNFGSNRAANQASAGSVEIFRQPK